MRDRLAITANNNFYEWVSIWIELQKNEFSKAKVFTMKHFGEDPRKTMVYSFLERVL